MILDFRASKIETKKCLLLKPPNLQYSVPGAWAKTLETGQKRGSKSGWGYVHQSCNWKSGNETEERASALQCQQQHSVGKKRASILNGVIGITLQNWFTASQITSPVLSVSNGPWFLSSLVAWQNHLRAELLKTRVAGPQLHRFRVHGSEVGPAYWCTF